MREAKVAANIDGAGQQVTVRIEMKPTVGRVAVSGDCTDIAVAKVLVHVG